MNDPHNGPADATPPQTPLRRDRHRRIGVFLALAALIVLGYFGQPYLKYLGPPERCWEIREVDGRLYKVNPCSGQFKLLGDKPER